MTAVEIITIITAFFALLVSILAYKDVNNIKNNFKSITGNSSAITELTINERITATKDKVSDIGVLMIPYISKPTEARTDVENAMIEAYNKLLDLAIENNLNAYEAACATYIDDKIDKLRFKILYKSEIKNVVEAPNLEKYFPSFSSKYKAILNVYDKWENLEKKL